MGAQEHEQILTELLHEQVARRTFGPRDAHGVALDEVEHLRDRRDDLPEVAVEDL